MGTFLELLPEDVLETKQDLPWAENIEQYCETAEATCLEKYDADSFWNSMFSSSSTLRYALPAHLHLRLTRQLLCCSCVDHSARSQD